MSRREFIVTSKTDREKENSPDLCWMEIAVDKLADAAKHNKKYTFIYHHTVDKFYLYSYQYSYDAAQLQNIFEKANTTKENNQGVAYSFLLNYRTGELFSMRDRKSPLVTVDKEGGKLPVRMADFDISYALHNIVPVKKPKFFLENLIARMAVFAPVHSACNQPPSELNRVRRKKGVTSDYDENGNRYDSNVYPRKLFVRAVEKEFRFTFEKGKYALCHVWDVLPNGERACYDGRYFARLANLVMLPRSFSSLTDHAEPIKAELQSRVFSLFKNFKPGDDAEIKKSKLNQKDWLPIKKIFFDK